MRLRFESDRDVWLFAGGVAIVSSFVSLLGIFLIYVIWGRSGFELENAIVFAGLLPIFVAGPISVWVGRTGLQLTRAQQNLRRLADTDPLTGLSNRRFFFSSASNILSSHQDSQRESTLLIIDADHFKDLNDQYGHAAGDRALINIAEVLLASFRESDLTCRVGGEEFAVLLPGVATDRAKYMAQRVLDKIADSPIVYGNAIITFSVSCGITSIRPGDTLAGAFKRADDAMYRAKEQGRNRIELAA